MRLLLLSNAKSEGKGYLEHAAEGDARHQRHRAVTGAQKRPEILAGEVRGERHAMRVAKGLTATRADRATGSRGRNPPPGWCHELGRDPGCEGKADIRGGSQTAVRASNLSAAAVPPNHSSPAAGRKDPVTMAMPMPIMPYRLPWRLVAFS